MSAGALAIGASTSCSSVRATVVDDCTRECLALVVDTSLAQARVALRCWRADYNDARPHSQLGWQTPSEFAATCNPRRDLALRYVESSAPAPAAPPAHQASQQPAPKSPLDETWGQRERDRCPKSDRKA